MRKLTQEEFIEKSKIKHNHKYDYSKTVYTTKRDKVIITCPIHGDFIQCAGHHMRGQGCPECGKLYASTWRQNDYKHFIQESQKRFGDMFEYPAIQDEYLNSHSKITLRCKKCNNIFVKIACDHLTSVSGGCTKCNCNSSNAEIELADFIKTIVDSPERLMFNNRTVLNGKEIDIVIPDLRIGIEYNGLFWHSENRKGKTVHLEKLEMCKKSGYKLIQIFEDEYNNHRDIVENKLRHLLRFNGNLPKISARKCQVSAITTLEAKEFLEKYHIQGFVASTMYYGAFFQDELIGVMTFKLSNRNSNDWELTRFATNYNYTCQGIGGKLFKHFVRNHNPNLVKSFADRRWTINEEDNLYIKLGFKFDKYILPDYRYMMSGNGTRFHKFGFRKQVLLKKYPDKLTPDMTESEMCEKIKAYRVWDCGLIKYIWRNGK